MPDGIRTGTNFERWALAAIGETASAAYTGTQGTVDTGAMTAFNGGVLFRIVCTTDAHVRQGTSSLTVTTADMPLFIGQEVYAIVADSIFQNDHDHFGAVQQTSGGTLYVTNMTVP